MLAAAVVVHDGPPVPVAPPVDTGSGIPFWKLTGSGNDFVFLDGRRADLPAQLTSPDGIRRLCARGTGIGADGVVLLEPAHPPRLRIRYFNADGSPADLCGNATLCTARLGALLRAAPEDGMIIETGAGPVNARLIDGEPELTLGSVNTIRATEPMAAPAAGERRIGYAVVGVPHLVVLVDDVEAVRVASRGPELRHTPGLAGGANVNWVNPVMGGWAIRTYERGVEAETLACGTGSVATGLLLLEWGLATSPIRLRTRSGRWFVVSVQREHDSVRPTLVGEGRIVFRGVLEDF